MRSSALWPPNARGGPCRTESERLFLRFAATAADGTAFVHVLAGERPGGEDFEDEEPQVIELLLLIAGR